MNTMKLKVIRLTVVCAAFAIATNAMADLELLLNTTTKEFALVGSDTGTPIDFIGQGFTFWSLSGIGGTSDDSVSYNNDVAFTTSVGTPGNVANFDTRLNSETLNGGEVALSLGTSSNSAMTITGTGTFQSYAGLDAGSMARFESAIGQSLSLVNGSGFSSIDVSAVPEPGTYATIIGMLALSLMIYRHHRK